MTNTAVPLRKPVRDATAWSPRALYSLRPRGRPIVYKLLIDLTDFVRRWPLAVERKGSEQEHRYKVRRSTSAFDFLVNSITLWLCRLFNLNFLNLVLFFQLPLLAY